MTLETSDVELTTYRVRPHPFYTFIKAGANARIGSCLKRSERAKTMEECFVCYFPLANTKKDQTPCCEHKVHSNCLKKWCDTRNTKNCPYCRSPMTSVPVGDADSSWQNDQHFVESTRAVWGDRPFWFGTERVMFEERPKTGFWGKLEDYYETKPKLCFLGCTKSQVISRMKTYLSFN